MKAHGNQMTRVLCFFLWLLPGPLMAQSVSFGTGSGPWDEGQASWVWHSEARWGAVAFGWGEASVLEGNSLIAWESFRQTFVWASAEVSSPWGVGGLTALSLPNLDLSVSKGRYPFDAHVSSALALGATWTSDHLVAGAGFLPLEGEVNLPGAETIGDFRFGVRGAFVGLPWLGLWYADLRANLDTRIDFFTFRPLDLKVRWDWRAAGLWGRWQGREGAWSWDLGAGMGLGWAKDGWGTQDQEWIREIILWPPSVTYGRSHREYLWIANPAWGAVVRPLVAWTPVQGLQVSLSRWLPLTGGWHFRQTPAPAPKTSARSSNPDRLNLWLAGVQVQVTVSW